MWARTLTEPEGKRGEMNFPSTSVRERKAHVGERFLWGGGIIFTSERDGTGGFCIAVIKDFGGR